MKALTLWQPWAQLVADGTKTVETRGWSTAYRGPLAVHAAATRRGYGVAPRALLQAAGDPDRLPLGRVLAVSHLVDVVPVEDVTWGTDTLGWRIEVERSGADHVESVYVGYDQRPLGDFSLGRYAWLLERTRRLADPVPAKGYQQLWRLPDVVEHMVRLDLSVGDARAAKVAP